MENKPYLIIENKNIMTKSEIMSKIEKSDFYMIYAIIVTKESNNSIQLNIINQKPAVLDLDENAKLLSNIPPKFFIERFYKLLTTIKRDYNTALNMLHTHSPPQSGDFEGDK